MHKPEFLMEITRHKLSYDYMYNDESMNDYQRRTKHNMLDFIKLIREDKIIFSGNNVQTVSNHPKFKHSDTIKAGNIEIECFVDQRNFNTPIHGIINAYDITNEKIDGYSMQWDNGHYIGRWLIHSSYYKKTGKDTKGYSGGCIIMTTPKMLELNKAMITNGIEIGDIISGVIIEKN